MADIELVIKIPEEYYKAIKEIPAEQSSADMLIIRSGTPLPKGHGRLKDADKLTRKEVLHLWYHLPNGDIACPKCDIDNAPTIIEADKE